MEPETNMEPVMDAEMASETVEEETVTEVTETPSEEIAE